MAQSEGMLWKAFLVVVLMAAPGRAADLHLWADGVYLACVTCPAADPRSACSVRGAGAPFAPLSIFNKNSRFGSPQARASPWNALSFDPGLPELRDDDGRDQGVFTLNTHHPRAFFRAGALAQVWRAAEGDLVVIRRWMCHEGGVPSVHD
jgi:hypothetical protein